MASIVIFPFMAQGHIIPAIDLAKSFSNRGLEVIIVSTPLNSHFIHSQTHTFPQISLSIINFPQGCQNVSSLPSPNLLLSFIQALKFLQDPFESILQTMHDTDRLPLCVVSDYFLGWTLNSCRRFGVPRLVFHGMGALPMLIVKQINKFVSSTQNAALISPGDDVDLSSSSLRIPFPIQKSDFIDDLWVNDAEKRKSFLSVVTELDEADVNSWGVIVNSFESLENEYISPLKNIYVGDAKPWFVGPLLLNCSMNVMNTDHWNSSIAWLERCRHEKVIYVSFGSTIDPQDPQMEELALGLELAKVPFIWVVKSPTWVAPQSWEDRVRNLGMVRRGWVNQRSILAHRAVGGFLSHCGWNSVLEAISAGVPLLAWPMGAEQPLNAKYITLTLKLGFMMNHQRGKSPAVISRADICAAVRELMDGKRGKQVREKAREVGEQAKKVMVEGGSSKKKFDELIAALRG